MVRTKEESVVLFLAIQSTVPGPMEILTILVEHAIGLIFFKVCSPIAQYPLRNYSTSEPRCIVVASLNVCRTVWTLEDSKLCRLHKANECCSIKV